VSSATLAHPAADHLGSCAPAARRRHRRVARHAARRGSGSGAASWGPTDTHVFWVPLVHGRPLKTGAAPDRVAEGVAPGACRRPVGPGGRRRPASAAGAHFVRCLPSLPMRPLMCFSRRTRRAECAATSAVTAAAQRRLRRARRKKRPNPPCAPLLRACSTELTRVFRPPFAQAALMRAGMRGAGEGNVSPAAAAAPHTIQHAAGAALAAQSVLVTAPAVVASFAPIFQEGGAEPVAAWQARPSRRALRAIDALRWCQRTRWRLMRLSLALCACLQAAQLMAACSGDVGAQLAAMGHAPPPPSAAEVATATSVALLHAAVGALLANSAGADALAAPPPPQQPAGLEAQLALALLQETLLLTNVAQGPVAPAPARRGGGSRRRDAQCQARARRLRRRCG
jgi:hypothetical protein